MHKGPVGPQSGRTPRSRAEELNSPKGFQDEQDPPYDAQAGVPVTKDTPRQAYKAKELTPSGSGGPVTDTSAPFTVKGA